MFSFRNTIAGLRTLTLGTAAAFAAVAATGASPARAGLTPVLPTPHAAEQSHHQILSNLYGGGFTLTGGGSFTNGGVTATRVNDLNDVAWTGGKLTLNPVASFSRSEQSLGLMVGKAGDSGYQSLFSVDQFGFLPGSPTTIDMGGGHWRFSLDNGATQLRSLSTAGENLFAGAGDQLVTYKIDGLGDGKSRYLLFWEDTPVAKGDRDYNDLVVEATFAGRGGPTAVPLPPAALVGLLGLGMAGAVAKWKKRKARAAA